MELPGLDRLMETCRAHNLSWLLKPPGQRPLVPGALVAGHPLDPVLASVYRRYGKAVFASDVAGIGIFQWDDDVNELEANNRSFQEYPQPYLDLPLVAFGGVTALAYVYATVPSLADDRGHQPVVQVDCYEAPSMLPVASDVDAFFGSYAAYLEALLAHPGYREPMDSPLVFPWEVPEILARDERLVAHLQSGRYEPLLPSTDETREWIARILEAAQRRGPGSSPAR